MKIVLKVILILVFAAIGVFAASFTSKVKTEAAKNPAAESNNTALSARELYVRNCARCHGADGKSQTNDGLRLDAPDLTELKPSKSKIVRVITGGADGMPAFGSKLKKTEINSVADYVRSL